MYGSMPWGSDRYGIGNGAMASSPERPAQRRLAVRRSLPETDWFRYDPFPEVPPKLSPVWVGSEQYTPFYSAAVKQHKQCDRDCRELARAVSLPALGERHVSLSSTEGATGALPPIAPRRHRSHWRSKFADPERQITTQEKVVQNQVEEWEASRLPNADPILNFVMRKQRGAAALKPHKLKHPLPPVQRGMPRREAPEPQ
jgi:hypothetical protein